MLLGDGAHFARHDPDICATGVVNSKRVHGYLMRTMLASWQKIRRDLKIILVLLDKID